MMRSESVRLVCFDWGGVILGHHRSWAEGCAAAGLPVHPETDTPECQQRRRVVSSRFQLGEIDSKTFFLLLREATNHLYSTEELERIHLAWLKSEYPGIGAIINRLNTTRGIETALLSNTNEAHWDRHLPRDGVEAEFPTIGMLTYRLASHLVGYAKPDERIYIALENTTGHQGSDILFFDDLPDNVEAAKKRGWRAELIDHTGDTAAQIESHLRRHGVW